MPPRYDVLVVGLGGMGSASAFHLARRGVRVLGLDRFEPAHANGSSHGGSRMIRLAYFEDPAYVPLLLRSYELWEEIGDRTGRDLLHVCGGLMLGSAQSQTVAGALASARQWDLPHELLGQRDLTRLFPTLRPDASTVALHEPRAGWIAPEQSVLAHLDAATDCGADLRFGQEVLSWSLHQGGGVSVQTAEATYEAGVLVLAPGPWAPQVLAELGLPLRVERHVQYWMQPPGGVGPYRDHPVWVWELPDGTQPYGFPAIDGSGGGVKVSIFHGGDPTDPDRVDRVVHDQEVTHLRDLLTTIIPSLAGELLKAVTCLYTVTPDEHFVVGFHPDHSGVILACGFSGHGFKFVPIIGEIVADLAQQGCTTHPIALFDPKRLLTSSV